MSLGPRRRGAEVFRCGLAYATLRLARRPTVHATTVVLWGQPGGATTSRSKLLRSSHLGQVQGSEEPVRPQPASCCCAAVTYTLAFPEAGRRPNLAMAPAIGDRNRSRDASETTPLRAGAAPRRNPDAAHGTIAQVRPTLLPQDTGNDGTPLSAPRATGEQSRDAAAHAHQMADAQRVGNTVTSAADATAKQDVEFQGERQLGPPHTLIPIEAGSSIVPQVASTPSSDVGARGTTWRHVPQYTGVSGAVLIFGSDLANRIGLSQLNLAILYNVGLLLCLLAILIKITMMYERQQYGLGLPIRAQR